VVCGGCGRPRRAHGCSPSVSPCLSLLLSRQSGRRSPYFFNAVGGLGFFVAPLMHLSLLIFWFMVYDLLSVTSSLDGAGFVCVGGRHRVTRQVRPLFAVFLCFFHVFCSGEHATNFLSDTTQKRSPLTRSNSMSSLVPLTKYGLDRNLLEVTPCEFYVKLLAGNSVGDRSWDGSQHGPFQPRRWSGLQPKGHIVAPSQCIPNLLQRFVGRLWCGCVGVIFLKCNLLLALSS
jgi:hypothetical protein